MYRKKYSVTVHLFIKKDTSICSYKKRQTFDAIASPSTFAKLSYANAGILFVCTAWCVTCIAPTITYKLGINC